MISIVDVVKTYNKQIVINHFSFTFEEKGFYLLFGPSGCGKTTLMNLIYGIETPDSGTITYEPKEYLILDNMAYVTQDSYFIDYLTIQDHLHLLGIEKEKYIEKFEQFSLVSVLDRFPGTLSGGERQRVSIILELLQHKKVILLDEPTASLDYKNKSLVFEMLESLKKQVLVICISHDEVSKQYCDVVINMGSQYHIENKRKIETKNIIGESANTNDKKVKLYPFIKKQEKYKNRWMFSRYIFMFVLVFTFLVIYLSANPEEKITSSLLKTYNLNYVQVLSINQEKIIDEIKSHKGVAEIDYLYTNTMKPVEGELDQVVEKKNTLPYLTLPKQNVYTVSNNIAFGKYASKENEIMLGSGFRDIIKFEPALSALQFLTDEEIVGKKISLPTNSGIYDVVISGIFEPFTDDGLNYYIYSNQGEQTINKNIFVTSALTRTLMYTQKLNSAATYYVYFESTNDLLSFVDYYSSLKSTDIKVQPLKDYLYTEINDYTAKSVFLIPIAVFCSLLALVFFSQSISLSLKYNQRILASYLYYKFTWRNVARAVFLHNLMIIAKLIFKALLLSIIIMYTFNFFNDYYRVYPYTLFMFDGFSASIFGFTILCICAITFSIIVQKAKVSKWYDRMKEERDLL